MPRSDLHIDIDEQSPLLRAERENGNPTDGDIERLHSDGSSENLASDEGVENKPWWYLFLLALSLGGLQIVWSVELGSGSPYLLSLGLKKSILAFVWIAGPLTGALVQPYVGIQSDNCRLSWGRRRPFMVGGGAATIISLLALAHARDIVGGLHSAFGGDREAEGVKAGAIVFATAWMYILDFSINTVQAAIRAFIVDNAPTHQQEEANAWASRLNGIGNVLGYTFGYADLPKIFPFLGKTQFEVLCAIATFALAITLFISCSIIKEEDPSLWGPPDRSGAGLFTFFRQTFRSVRRLQPQVRKICEVQLANWIAWFPFLFYMTTFIGQLYVNPYLEKNEKDHNLSDRDIDQLWQEGTRVGTFALLIYSITSFASNVFLPFLVIPTYIPRGMQKVHSVQSMVVATSPIGSRPRTPMAIPRTPGNDPSVYFPETDPAPAKPPSRLARLLNHLRIPGLTLRRLWMFAQILFAVCMFSTFFIRTPMLGAIMTAFVGVSWSVSLWAPFALISAEIAKSADKVREHYLKKAAKRQKSASSDSSASASPVPKPSNPQPVEDDNEIDERDEVTAQAGIILGLHNCSISAPQIVATLISSAVFRALQKPRGTPGDDSVGWVLRLAGVAALVAAYMTSRLDDRKDDDGSEE